MSLTLAQEAEMRARAQVCDPVYIAPEELIALLDKLAAARGLLQRLYETRAIKIYPDCECSACEAVRAARAHLATPADAPVVAQCSGCRAYTRDRRAITCCGGRCQDPTGKSCNSLACPGCRRHHYWTGSFKLPGADATIFDAPADEGKGR